MIIDAALPMKPVLWVGSSLKDLKEFPRRVRGAMGHAIYAAQCGDTDPAAKPLKGFGGAAVMEIVERFDGNTYRSVYTATLGDTLYVLHAFQKTAKAGISTPKREIDLIRARLKEAERIQQERQNRYGHEERQGGIRQRQRQRIR